MSLPIKNSKDMNVKPVMGKTVDRGGVFHPVGGLMGAPGVMAGGDGLPDVDEASGCSGWIVWQILGRYDLTLTA